MAIGPQLKRHLHYYAFNIGDCDEVRLWDLGASSLKASAWISSGISIRRLAPASTATSISHQSPLASSTFLDL